MSKLLKGGIGGGSGTFGDVLALLGLLQFNFIGIKNCDLKMGGHRKRVARGQGVSSCALSSTAENIDVMGPGKGGIVL